MAFVLGKSRVKVYVTDQGSHGHHWGPIFGLDERIDAQNCVRAMWDDVRIETEIDARYATVRAKYGVFSLLGIQDNEDNDGVSTLFPALYSTKSMPLEITEVLEWQHVDAIEAQVRGIYRGILHTVFFATDYLENKKKYLKGGTLNVSLTGLAYSLDSGPDLSERFSPDFCCFTPHSNAPFEDDYDFTSNLLSVSDVKVKEDNLKHFEIRLYNGSHASETANLAVIMNERNIVCSRLNVGDKVSGTLWMQGRLLR